MLLKCKPIIESKKQNSILAFSNQATSAYESFTKEDFLNMMLEMSSEEIELDLNRFKNLKLYNICKKIQFVLREKREAEVLSLKLLLTDVDI